MNKKAIFLLILLIIIPNFLTIDGSATVAIKTTNVRILLVMDNEYGLNYGGIIQKLEQFKWHITLAGPTDIITSCDDSGNNPLEMDILFSEIDDVTDYNCISILPGGAHENILANEGNILDKIKTAADEGIIISAWCRAVRCLAAADVINGRNITGHEDYFSEYVAAGATFFQKSPPIIDGNIVTSCRSLFYQTEICLAIAKAIGCFETDAPEHSNLRVEYFENTIRQLLVDITDESSVLTAKVTFTYLGEDTEENPPALINLFLSDDDKDGTYNCTIPEKAIGLYQIDLFAEDVFWNSKTSTNITTTILSTSQEASFDKILSIVFFSIAFIVVFIRKVVKK